MPAAAAAKAREDLVTDGRPLHQHHPAILPLLSTLHQIPPFWYYALPGSHKVTTMVFTPMPSAAVLPRHVSWWREAIPLHQHLRRHHWCTNAPNPTTNTLSFYIQHLYQRLWRHHLSMFWFFFLIFAVVHSPGLCSYMNTIIHGLSFYSCFVIFCIPVVDIQCPRESIRRIGHLLTVQFIVGIVCHKSSHIYTS